MRTAKSEALDRHVVHVVLLEAAPDEEAVEAVACGSAADSAGNMGGTSSDTGHQTWGA